MSDLGTDPTQFIRTCSRCGQTKPVEEFHIRYRSTGERLTWCRACMAEVKRAWYLRNTEHQKELVRLNWERSTRENRDAIWTYLASHACVDCGESDPLVLQFDHVDRKRKDIAKMMRGGFAWTTVEQEIAKCEIRCGNCHRRKTAREQGIYDVKHAYLKVEDSMSTYRVFDN